MLPAVDAIAHANRLSSQHLHHRSDAITIAMADIGRLSLPCALMTRPIVYRMAWISRVYHLNLKGTRDSGPHCFIDCGPLGVQNHAYRNDDS